MGLVIKFKKGRILLGIISLLVILLISTPLILTPETFLRNKYSSTQYIQLIGILMAVFTTSQIISYIPLFNRKNAITLTENALIDHSRFESLGTIPWSEISKITQVKKRTIQIHLKKSYSKKLNSNIIKVFLRASINWHFKSSVIIVDSFLDINRDQLYEELNNYRKRNKKQWNHILKNS